MKLIGWQNGRCGVVWLSKVLIWRTGDVNVPSKSLRFFVTKSFDREGRFMPHPIYESNACGHLE